MRDAADNPEVFAVEDGWMLSRESAYATSFVVLGVLGGIAVGDAICILETGKYARCGDHNGAARVLQDAAGRAIVKHLDTLLGVKSKAGYSPYAIGGFGITNAQEAADAFLNAAR